MGGIYIQIILYIHVFSFGSRKAAGHFLAQKSETVALSNFANTTQLGRQDYGILK